MFRVCPRYSDRDRLRRAPMNRALTTSQAGRAETSTLNHRASSCIIAVARVVDAPLTVAYFVMPNQRSDYDYVLGILAAGNQTEFAELEKLVDGFPNGVDDFIGRRWITNAIDCGSLASIKWLLSRGVELSFRDEEGYTVLHSALERAKPDRDEILRLLLQHGADVNAHGINDWTPAHMAAIREDIEALKLLIQFGADLSIRTRIDDYATPLEEARKLKKTNAVQFLEGHA